MKRNTKPTRWPVLALLGLGLGLAQAAAAHDTWLALRGTPRADGLRLLLGTGERFPLMQTSVGRVPLAQAGCRFGAGEPTPLRAERDLPEALQLAAAGDARGAWTCWAQLAPQDIELTPVHVQRYLDEVRADAAVRSAWQAQLARGLPWRERFTKHARREQGADKAVDAAQPASAAPMAMDILPSQLPRRPGEWLRAQLRRDGQPLAGLAVELVGAQAPSGLWLRSDAQGWVESRVPLGGAWLLRATELRPNPASEGAWTGGFVTLAFDIDHP